MAGNFTLEFYYSQRSGRATITDNTAAILEQFPEYTKKLAGDALRLTMTDLMQVIRRFMYLRYNIVIEQEAE